MSDRFNFDCPKIGCKGKLRLALSTLLEAADYAVDTASDRWDFAVSVQMLLKLGLNDSDLRWLIRKGFVNHAREVTVSGDDGREFRPLGNLTFTHRTCFVLTDPGVVTARSVLRSLETQPLLSGTTTFLSGRKEEAHPSVVNWDAATRRLSVNGTLVKRFKWPAINQEAVLNAFQEEGWPPRIDDPLSPLPDLEPKRRLSDTIKCLNRKLSKNLIHFRGDGTGEGILWEHVEPLFKENGLR